MALWQGWESGPCAAELARVGPVLHVTSRPGVLWGETEGVCLLAIARLLCLGDISAVHTGCFHDAP